MLLTEPLDGTAYTVLEDSYICRAFLTSIKPMDLPYIYVIPFRFPCQRLKEKLLI